MIKIKPGYIIIGAIAIFVAYKYIFDDSEVRKLYTQEVNRVLTDLKHEDSFALQSKLAPELKQIISIEDIYNYINSVKLGSRYKFELKKYDEEKGLIKIEGLIVKQDKKESIDIEFKDINGTLYIKNSVIGNNKLRDKQLSFPIVSIKSN